MVTWTMGDKEYEFAICWGKVWGKEASFSAKKVIHLILTCETWYSCE